MAGLFGGSAGVGLEVGQGALRMAGVKKRRGAHVLEWTKAQELPAGLVVDSLTEPNITDMPAFVDALSDLVGAAGYRKAQVNIVLPDYVSRVSILDFDTLQGSEDETAKMLKWRLKKLLPFDVEQATMRHQYLGRFKDADAERHRFLVSLIKTDILGQYMQAFEAAGIKPVSVGITSFSIWNMFHDYITTKLGESASFALMNIFGRKMTVMVFNKGAPHFLRLKDLGKLDSAVEQDPAISTARLARELNVSLTYYRENYSATPVGKVFMAGDIEGVRTLAEEVSKGSDMDASVLDVADVLELSSASPMACLPACGAAMEP